MRRPLSRALLAVLAFWVAAMACNIQFVSPEERAARTATAEVAQAWTEAIAAWGCPPAIVIPSTNPLLVYAGPEFVYEIVGQLPLLESVPIVGRSADGRFWYIEFAAGPGGHGWVTTAVAVSSCPPEEVPIATPAFPPPTQCQPTVTANQNANVRAGPSTLYAIVGNLLSGQTATIAGKNAEGTWWYIDFADGPGGHGWIAASTVTPSCVSDTVSVITPPPLPATDTPSPVAKPDLIVSEFTISPESPTSGVAAHVRIGVYNQGGSATGGSYVVHWYGLSSYSEPSCSWTVDSTKPQGGRILECDFAFPSWYPHDKTSLVVVDAGNEIAEGNENNNEGTISPFGVDPPLT